MVTDAELVRLAVAKVLLRYNGLAGHDFEHALHERYGITVMRPARKDEPDHGSRRFLAGDELIRGRVRVELTGRDARG